MSGRLLKSLAVLAIAFLIVPRAHGGRSAGHLHVSVRRHAAAGQPAVRRGGAAGQGDRRSALGPRHRAAGRRSADRALRRRLGRHRQRRVRRLARGPGQGGRHVGRSRRACTRCISTTRPAAISRPKLCWPRAALSGDHVRRRVRRGRRSTAPPRRCAESLSAPKTVTHLGVGAAASSRSPRIAACWAPTAR